MKRKIKAFGGSGNVFRDFGYPDADLQQHKCLLASEILKTLDREGLTVRAAAEKTGTAAADFSRIRKADLGRFTVDRLMTIVHRLGGQVEVNVKVKRAPTEART
jgi:predicted XRE-type DNA-binding protein